MRTIESATVFRKELKKLRAHPDHSNIDPLLEEILALLVIDRPLPIKDCDHPLIGPYKGFRDCHIKSDIVLIYSKPKKPLGLHGLGRILRCFEVKYANPILNRAAKTKLAIWERGGSIKPQYST
jgi:mRNA interferase YafQ